MCKTSPNSTAPATPELPPYPAVKRVLVCLPLSERAVNLARQAIPKEHDRQKYEVGQGQSELYHALDSTHDNAGEHKSLQGTSSSAGQ